MNLELIEPHPRRVLDALRQGEFDGLEILGQADEKNFFELCFREKMLDELAAQMPTARKKEEVPRWFVLAANLSLKLHGEHSFLAWDRVVRCGGLLSAMDPAWPPNTWIAPSTRWCCAVWGLMTRTNMTARRRAIGTRCASLCGTCRRRSGRTVQLPLVSFTREELELPAGASEKALVTIRRMKQSFLCPAMNLRPPVTAE